MSGRAGLEVRFHAQAEEDYNEAAGYYAGISPDLSRRFQAEVSRGMAFIAQNPESARVIRKVSGARRKVLNTFPYSLIYIVEPERIRILAVAHHKRRVYWSSRAKRP